MDNSGLYNELIELANKEQLKIEQSLPEDDITCRGLLVETVRVLDFMMLGQPGVDKNDKIPFSVIDLNLIEMGWNLSTAMLLKKGNHLGFPMMRSTCEFRNVIISLLYQLGIIIQLRRTAEMVKVGMVNVQKNGSTITFSQTLDAQNQYLDELEFEELDKLEEKIKSSGTTYNDWNLIDYNAIKDVFWQVGNFMSLKNENEFTSYKLEDIDSHMIPLIKQWDSGKHGIMMGYGSTPEIDDHFLAIAAELIAEWRDEAGIHPKTKIGRIYASDIMAVATIIISFHIKHIQFTLLASAKDPEINIPQSISIWTPIAELIKDISDYSGIDKDIVKEAIYAVTISPEDVNFLKKNTSRFRPLLIDIGSGFVFRPASCVFRNPLHSVYTLLVSRDPSLIDKISHSREEWLRHYLYAMFMGNRYQRVEGNIKIRKDGKIITDIDAIIYDNLTGELALIQIKWQNYFTNDVRKLRSRAKNFVEEIVSWTEKVNSWVDSHDITHVITSLQLKHATDKLTKEKIYLFGLSKNAARMQGYGYELNDGRIAVGTWTQFKRNRAEIGPAPLVISRLFKNLKDEEIGNVESKPMPVEIPFAGLKLYFKDIWSVTGDTNKNQTLRDEA